MATAPITLNNVNDITEQQIQRNLAIAKNASTPNQGITTGSNFASLFSGGLDTISRSLSAGDQRAAEEARKLGTLNKADALRNEDLAIDAQKTKFNQDRLAKQDDRNTTLFNQGQEQYARDEKTYNDTQSLLSLSKSLTGNREANIEQSRALKEQFSRSVSGGASFDGSGNLVIDPNLPQEQQDMIQQAYSQFATTLPSIKTDKEQISELGKLGQSLNADPSTITKLKDNLRTYQQERIALDPEQEAFLNNETAKIDANLQAEAKTLNDAFQQFSAQHPVDVVVTPKQEEIKVRSAIADFAASIEDLDDSDITEAVEFVDGITVTNPYTNEKVKPAGWIVEQALIGSHNNSWIGLDTIETDRLQTSIESIMQAQFKSDYNRKLVADEQAALDAKLLTAFSNSTNQKNKKVTEAKAKSYVYRISSNPSATLSRAIERNSNN